VDSVAPVPLGDRHQIQAGNIEAGHAGCFLEHGERLEIAYYWCRKITIAIGLPRK
jgi:hypothetical protein